MFILDTSRGSRLSPDLVNFHGRFQDLDTSVGELRVTYLDWNDFKTALQPSKQPPRLPEPHVLVQTALKNEHSKIVESMSHLLRRVK